MFSEVTLEQRLPQDHPLREIPSTAEPPGHPGDAISLSRRWLVEKSFGWLKQTGPLRQVELRGLHRVDRVFVFNCDAHNLLRLPRLIANQLRQGSQPQCA